MQKPRKPIEYTNKNIYIDLPSDLITWEPLDYYEPEKGDNLIRFPLFKLHHIICTEINKEMVNKPYNPLYDQAELLIQQNYVTMKLPVEVYNEKYPEQHKKYEKKLKEWEKTK